MLRPNFSEVPGVIAKQVDARPAAGSLVELCQREHREPLDVIDGRDALGNELAQVLASDCSFEQT